MGPLLAMGLGLGANLLGGALSNAAQRRAFKSYKPQQYDTGMYDEYESMIKGANFDAPLYDAFQNSQRGAAAQNARIYAQQGNSALAADRTAWDRRSAEAGLFSGVMQNNLNRMGMLGSIADRRSEINMANTDMMNQRNLSMANMRAQTSFGSLLGNTISGAGAMGMNYGMNEYNRNNMLKDRKDWMAYNMDMMKEFNNSRSGFYSNVASGSGRFGFPAFNDSSINRMFQGENFGPTTTRIARTSSGMGFALPGLRGLGI